ncbi:MAG: ABC transporter ATP-binding protein [Desulfobacteraceae bacterium]|nr:ABC transporter ATP-binding protein [Desulfobacteraceae bacterium]
MKSDDAHSEQRMRGRTYDIRLLINLFPFVNKYKWLILASIGLVIFITLLDLTIPYLTKIAIDEYIVPAPASVGGEEHSRSAGKERWLYVDVGEPAMEALMLKYPGIFHHDGQRTRMAYEDLPQLEKADLVVLRGKDLKGLFMVALLFLAAVIVNFLLNFAQKVVMEYAGHRIMHDLRMKLFNHIQTLSISFFNRNPVARLVTRVTNDVQNMHELFTSVISLIFKDLFLLVGIAIVLLGMHLKLALLSFLILPLVLVSALTFSTRIRDVFRELRIQVAQINTHFAETVGGIKVIQAFGREKTNYQRFSQLNHENYILGMRQIHIFAIFMPMIEIFGVSSIAIVIYFGGVGVLDDSITLGVFVAFITYMKMFFRPIRDLAEKYNILQNAMSSAERIFYLLQTDERVADDYAIGPYTGSGYGRMERLEFDAVSFSYNEKETILDRVSFALNSGQKLAIVGPTGSGKTTLINLIVRFYNPVSGRILINGSEITDLSIHDLRSMMAMVSQDPFLFSGSIRDNILIKPDPATDARLSEIVRAARCEKLIQRLPDGLDTRLNEAGSALSAGERQLISIARAFSRNPSLIILDEATSYIDSETEIQLQEALENLMSGRTSIVVAHRLTTARNADKIMVLNHGRVIESGSHTQLMTKKGFYSRMIQLQNGDDSVLLQKGENAISDTAP